MVVGGSVLGNSSTLEVRWIRPGSLTASMTEWFGSFGGEFESREDAYLVGQEVRGLSVKIRGGSLLDVKVTQGDGGVVDLPGRVRGRLQAWKKWSFPIPLVSGIDDESLDWVRVGKMRRIVWFSIADGEPTSRGSVAAAEATCAVELTEVVKGGESWWTLGFEANGPTDALPGAIDATAAVVFREHLPDGLELSLSDSMSYSEWLHRPASVI